MKREEFIAFCERSGELLSSADGVKPVARNTVEERVKDCGDYRFVQAFADLFNCAYAAVKSCGDRFDAYEAAGTASAARGGKDYRFSAYRFAVCVIAAALEKTDVEETDYESLDANELKFFEGGEPDADETDPVKKKLKKYAVRLLDFSRNNRLVHFRTSGKGALSLVSQNFERTVRLVSDGNKIFISQWKKLKPQTVYKCKTCGRYAFGKYDPAKKTQFAEKCPVCDEGDSRGRKSMVPLKEKLTFTQEGGFVCGCGEIVPLKRLEGEGLCPRCGKKIVIESFPLSPRSALDAYAPDEAICLTGDADSAETAKSLVNKARNMERNFGLHVLYFACGFLEWKDAGGTEYNSPLLLCPVNMYLDRSTGGCRIEGTGAFEVNKTLIHMLGAYSSSCSVTLPELDAGAPQTYLNLVERAFSQSTGRVKEITADWKVKREAGVGLFHYQKLQLENDLTENAEKYLRHPVIRRLCGDFECEVPPAKQISDSARYMLLNADSSQEDVIRASQEGKSFILQGPPGSGKSQTITNMIAVALGEGKSVLFVTEKASARAVISENLNRCRVDGVRSLNDFVLDFDNFAQRGGAIGREPFVNELNACLTPYTPAGGYDEDSLAAEAYLREKVVSFMDAMRKDYGGRSCLRILRDAAKYAEFKILDCAAVLPRDKREFTALCDLISRYYVFVESGAAVPDYKSDSLYGCKGDTTGALYRAAVKYKGVCADIKKFAVRVAELGLEAPQSKSELEKTAETLALWSEAPRLNEEITKDFTGDKLENLINRAESRANALHYLNSYRLSGEEREIDVKKFSASRMPELKAECKKYSRPLKRLGSGYKKFVEEVFGLFHIVDGKINYKTTVAALNKLENYAEYIALKEECNTAAEEDIKIFGLKPSSESEFAELAANLLKLKDIISRTPYGSFVEDKFAEWLAGFASGYAERVKELKELSSAILSALASVKELRGEIAGYFVTDVFERGISAAAELVIKERDRLADYFRANAVIEEISERNLLPVLDSLASAGIGNFTEAEGCLYKTYYKNETDSFVSENGLDALKNFSRPEHEKLLERFAQTNVKALSSGAARLYENLSSRLKNAGGGGSLPKLRSQTGYSIKRTVAENIEYIRRIKPCFMMSPLNASQYLDIDVAFDLVIFDEASQIFTEDALASIVRGKQIIIAGDSKQLPPCDFFRAGEASQDYGDDLYDDEENKENSLLVTADGALSDSSVSLCWHYRSCDEALIAFSNENMEYNLITFPSAVKNPDDGIEYIRVPYSKETCYESGKGCSHVNKGEAQRIVELIFSEMTHPTRKNFSIGVVAFSNAQASEIENRWDIFRQQPDKRGIIEEWEKSHAEEPVIFCNLDTMQGDERDTMIISVCYSVDRDGKFTLPYLGRIRLPSGKKRINVAVTRSRHRMAVVSTLDYLTLKAAADASSAPEENKEGARMLCDFLKYAESFVTDSGAVCAPAQSSFVKSVCRVLDNEGIAYDTEIGRSECKINIGIKNAAGDGYALGIIADDPLRPDFDSPVEYARLTEQVLRGKYNWELYRVFPLAWINDYEAEKRALLEKIQNLR